MYNENEITLTMTKKQLKSVVSLMGIALETDCKQMNEMSEKKLENLSILHEVLQDISNQTK
jgi:hypothetical protein